MYFKHPSFIGVKKVSGSTSVTVATGTSTVVPISAVDNGIILGVPYVSVTSADLDVAVIKARDGTFYVKISNSGASDVTDTLSYEVYVVEGI